jgi:hypothetical protein
MDPMDGASLHPINKTIMKQKKQAWRLIAKTSPMK